MFFLKPNNLKIPDNRAKNNEAHTAPKKFGMGDYYGTGMKQPMGKVRDATVGSIPVDRGQLKTPPKSLA